jgi:predicted aspartyl protease
MAHRNIYIWLWVSLALAGCAAPPQAAVDTFEPALYMPQPTVRIPLINGGNLQWRVRATVNGESGIFILDTGANFSIITPQFAEKLGLYDAAMGKPGATRAKESTLKYAPINSFKLGSIEYFGFYAAILDLDHISRAIDAEVAGILGNNLLNQTAYAIDWKRNLLTLESRTVEIPTNALRISIHNNRIFCPVRINGKEIPFALDTGAYRCLLAEPEIANLSIPGEKISQLEVPEIDITDAQRRKRPLVTLDKLLIGTIDRRSYPMLVWNHNVLGMDLLEGYILTVDARRNWLLLSEKSSPLELTAP